MPSRKRRVNYPPPRSATEPGLRSATKPGIGRPTLVSIDLGAQAGRAGLAIGDRVRILGTGLYAGQTAAIEGFASGAVPAALVRTEAGRSRRVRTIDLEPIRRD